MEKALSDKEMNAILEVVKFAQESEKVAKQIAIAILANPEQTLAALKLGVAKAKIARGESIKGWY